MKRVQQIESLLEKAGARNYRIVRARNGHFKITLENGRTLQVANSPQSRSGRNNKNFITRVRRKLAQ